MKPPRLLLLLVGALLVLLAAAAGVARIPGVQHWAVCRAAASRPGLDLHLGHISVGPSHALLEDVQVKRGSVTVKFVRAELDYSLFALLFRSRLALGYLRVSGVEIEASHLSPQSLEAGAAAAPGVLGRLLLPVEIVLGRIEVQGRALLPGAPGRPSLQAEYQLTGGGVAPGQEGTLHVQAKLTDPAVSARVGTLQAVVDLRLLESRQRNFASVGLNAVVDASGPGLTGHDQLRLSAQLDRSAAGENYTLRLDTLQGAKAANLLLLDAALPAAGTVCQGSWSLSARTAQLEPFFLGGALPDFDLRGKGGFTFRPDSREATLAGELEGEVDELGVVRPALRALGAIKFHSRIDLASDRQTVRLNHLELSLAGEAPVLELQVSNAAAYDLAQHRLLFGGTGTGEVLRLKLLGVPVAWARPFLTACELSGGTLQGEVAVSRNAGQQLVATTPVPLRVDELTLLQGGRVWFARAELLAKLEGELSPKGGRLHCEELRLRTPEGDNLLVQATAGATPAPASALTLQFDYAADLPRLLAPWLPVGPVRAQGTVELALQGSRLSVQRFVSVARNAKGEPLLEGKITRPFVLELPNLALEGDGAETELATFRTGLWPMLVLGRVLPGVTVTGAASPGEFLLRGAGARLTLQAGSPVRLSGFTLDYHQHRLLDQATLEASPAAELTAGRLSRLTTGPVVLRAAGGGELGQFTAELTRAPEGGVRSAFGFNCSLPDLAEQPALAGLAALSAGRASGEIRTSAGAGTLLVEARATLNGLVLQVGHQALPVANLSLRAEAAADGHLSLQAPILLDRSGLRTDLNLSLEGVRTHPGLKIEAALSGEHADLADILLLLSAVGTTEAAGLPEGKGAGARALSPPAADVLPFWQGLTGQITLDLKSVTRGQEWNMTGLAGRLAIEPTRLHLEKIEANFGEKSRLAVHGDLRFAPVPNPYTLQGDLSLTEFDAGKWYKATDPAHPPAIEGLFTLTGHAEGQGLTFADTLDRIRGELQVTSRQGIFRGFKGASAKLSSVASKAVEWSAALGAILGTDRVKQTAEKMAGRTYAVEQLAQYLAEIKYDQLSVVLIREPSLNLRLQDISLVSPEIRLLGSGLVTRQEGQPLLAQPLTATLTLAARGKLEQSLHNLGELSGGRDELGYARAKNAIPLGGTLARPDPRPYFNWLASSKAGEFLTPDN